MADRTSSSITIGAGRSTIMAVIADFPAYPQWAGQVKAAEVLETGEDGRATRVRFVLDAGVISDEYVLGYDWTDDAGVSWRIVDAGRMVSGLTGSYRLTENGGGTEVTYDLAVDLKVPMIGMIKRKAEKVIVDTALKGLKRRVEGR
ncbi:cyclase [Microbispora triticiradicis]|uniref:SRPBCC family protein n=2 Tax=Microbispora triticiradicis TaxID=2200763 RepID=A0A5R8YK31_9ACTN|nr:MULTISPECIES: SRPBCC family protein [Microbispora]MBO4273974.1 cyclase [Microbispora triticiradicis]RGA01745.1 cyclase [Microbispora triticiradicis]TLP53195.1 SRPBCC family protein [Microbispora fusca]